MHDLDRHPVCTGRLYGSPKIVCERYQFVSLDLATIFLNYQTQCAQHHAPSRRLVSTSNVVHAASKTQLGSCAAATLSQAQARFACCQRASKKQLQLTVTSADCMAWAARTSKRWRNRLLDRRSIGTFLTELVGVSGEIRRLPRRGLLSSKPRPGIKKKRRKQIRPLYDFYL